MFSKLKPKSEFSRNVLTLMTGTTIAQAIPIAISPILTRIYSPEDFGIFALYMSLVSAIAVLVTGKYELAILIPKKNEDAANILTLSIVIAITISFLLFLIILIFNEEITKLLGNQKISIWLYFIPLSVLLSGMYQSFNYWSNRNKEYKLMSKAIVLQSSSNAIGNLSFGFVNFAFVGLILTSIIKDVISLFYLVFKNKTSIEKYKNNIKINKMKILMYQYKQFPLHTLPQNFIYQGTLQLPIFVIKSMLSFAILGFFSLAYRVIATPISIIGNSLGQVYYQKASIMYQKDKEELYFYTRKMFIKLLLLSITIGATLIIFLPDLFSFIFGEKWVQAGKIAQYLMIYIIFNFALSPFTKIYLISKYNLFYLKWEIVRFISFSVLFIILYILNINSIEMFFLSFSILHFFMYILISIPILTKESFIWNNNV